MFFTMSTAQINNAVPDTVVSILFILLTVISIVAAIWLLVKFINTKVISVNVVTALSIIICIGVIVRVALSFVSVGNRQELYALFEAAKEWSKYGPSQYIKRHYFQQGGFVYPLQYFYAGVTVGSLLSVGVDESSLIMQFVLKLPLIVADVVTALLIYRAASKYVNKYTGIILAGFVMLCPLFVFSSAIWTSVYSVLAMLTLAVFYYIIEKKYALAIVLYTVSALLVREASYLFPLLAVYFVYIWIKRFKTFRKAGTESKAALRDVVGIPVTIVACLIAQYLICLPLTIYNAELKGEFFKSFYKIFIYPLNQFEKYSNNALSIYNIFGRGGWATDVIFRDQRAVFFIISFAAIIAAITAIVYLYAKNRAVLTLVAAYSLFLLHTSYFDFTITSLLPVIMLMLFAFVLIKDKRILIVAFGQSLLMMIMMVLVYISAGYYNNLPMSLFIATEGQIELMQLTSTTWGTVAAITLSVLSVLNFLYMTKVLINITMSEQRMTLGGNQQANVTTAVKYFFKH